MASYFDQISSLNPKIWYRFNETAGTSVNSGSATSTLSNFFPLLNEQTDVDGRAIYVNDDSGDFSQMPEFTLFDDRSFTIETWFKTNQSFIGSRNSAGLWGFRGRTTNLSLANNSVSVVRFNLNIFGGTHATTADRYKIQFNSSINDLNVSQTITSAVTVADDKWHHAVVTINTSSFKFYLDGQLVGSVVPTTMPARFFIDNSATHFGINYKLIGASATPAFGAEYYNGYIDEFAAYDYELSAQNVLDNYNAGVSVNFADTPGTASALAVQPTLITQAFLTADPMTASSASGNHFASNYNVVPPLESYLESLTLDQYIKFTEYHSARNYALNQSSNQAAITFYGNADNVIDGGLQLSGVIKFVGSGTTGRIIMSEAAVNNELTDGNFVLGFWLKIPSINDLRNIITSYNSTTAQGIRLDLNSAGQLQFQIENNQVHTITGTDVIDDDQWHFVVLKVSSNNYSIWVDDVQDASGTFNGQYPGSMAELGFGSNNIGSRTGYINLSHFFIGSTTNVTTGILTNIYDYGQEQIHAKAIMNPAVAKFNTAYNDQINSDNPTLDFRLNEGSGADIVTDAVKALVANIQGTARTSGIATRNNKGINFTNIDTRYVGTYAAPSGTFSTANKQTISVFFKTNGVADDFDRICSTGMESLNGLSIETSPSGRVLLWSWTDNHYLEIRTDSGTIVNGQWHHVVAVKDGNNAYIYFDGKQAATDTMQFTLSDTVRAAIGGVGVVEYGEYDYSASRNTTIDEFAIFPSALTAQEAFELYQSISLEMETTASSTFVMPTVQTGTGAIIVAAPMTASAEMIYPAIAAPFLSAHAEFLMPNFAATSVIDVNYGHTAATADALFHDPQANIGENHIADHMDASALMVQPIISANGRIVVSTAVTGDAIFVMPGIVTIKGARVFAEPARANAFIPLPPAYLQLTDDQWYVRLFAQHAEQNVEPAFITGSTTTASTQVAKTVLKFFDDVTSSITVGNGYLENDLEEKIFEAPGSTNTAKTKIYPSIAPNLTPTPALYTGYFDDFGRKAVRVENIEFAMPENIYNSLLPFSLEFSIKTTKANQIIAKGKWNSFTANQKLETGFGLYDGKLYMMNSNTTSGVPGNRTPHPANPDMAGNPVMIGRKNIADGQWHHIIVQYGFTDDRIQFWCDGQLDRQIINAGLRNARLYIMGSNNGITTYQSNFETSGWSYDKQAFISEQDVDLNYIGYLKYEPIAAEPMKATITMTDKNTAAGNRGRAILFYFWPEDVSGKAGKEPLEQQIPGGGTFDPVVTTDDFFRKPPQEWYGWDLYPVDITGRYVSELVKPEAYGVNNIKIQEPSFTILTGRENPAEFAYKVNTEGNFVDPVTDARRYIDVFNDIDLSQFDAIFFKNYPEETVEKDAYTREEFADEYFNLRERQLFDNFITSLRKGLDTGISLFITNHQLALDLGIIDRVEDVTNVYDGEFDSTDDYVISRTGEDKLVRRTTGVYPDLHKNNRHRVVNTLPNLTNDGGYIWKDWFYFENDDTIDFGGPNRPYTRIENRANGLQIGDEFIISDDTLRASSLKAVPIANVKAGKVITAFANQIYQNNTLVDNPFKNYATTIAVEPGTILNGKPTVGKIFVTFTEGFQREFRANTQEYFHVDLIQDEFINAAYNDGEISLAKRDELLASPNNLDRRLEAAIAANNQTLINTITNLKYWNNNGDYILTQATLLDDPTGSGIQQDGFGKGVRKGRVNRVNKKGATSTQTVTSSLQWFSFTYARQYERAQFAVASMLSRGIRWLSDKIVDDGLVNRVEAMKVSTSELPMPTITGDKPASVNAERMLAIANLIPATGYALADVSNTTLPLTANANFGQFVKSIKPDVFTASATFRDNVRTLGVAEDQIVVYINHVDPILYIREEVIK